jgi:hypothetical protein
MDVLRNIAEHTGYTVLAISGDFTCKSGFKILPNRFKILNLPCKYSF